MKQKSVVVSQAILGNVAARRWSLWSSCFLLLSLIVAPLYAASPGGTRAGAAANLARPEFHRVDHGSPRLHRIQTVLRSGGAGAASVIENGATTAVVIPAAGNTSGANGTYFRSDVTLMNLGDTDQGVVVIWLPNGQPDEAVEFEGTIAKGWPVTYPDFVGTELELTGVGALVILPVDADGEIEASAAIDAYSRIWSPSVDGAAGTFSQSFAGADIFHLLNSNDAVILGLRQDEGFRTNYGIVNMGEFDQIFYISVIDQEGVKVAETDAMVRSGEMILRPLPEGVFGHISLVVSSDELFGSWPNVWTTFASSTDNATGDGWVSIGGRIDREWIRDR